MRKIFLNSISFVFLAGLLLTAYPVQGQRKTPVKKKVTTVSKTKLPAKSTSATKSVNVQSTVSSQTVVPNPATQDLLTRIETNTSIYHRELTRALTLSNLNGTDSESMINAYIADFENATKTLRSRVNSGNDSTADVQDVLSRAEFIQGFLRDNALTPAVQNQWKLLTDNLTTLANSYKVSWNINANPIQNNQSSQQTNQPNQNNQTTPGNQPNNYPVNQPNYQNNQPRNNYSNARFDLMLTGTYRLNESQSDNVSAVLDKTLNNTSNNQTAPSQSDRMRRDLERRLASPEMVVIEKINNDVTIASNLSPQVTVTADNTTRTEMSPNGRNMSVKAGTISNSLEISYQGDRVNDFFLTFMPVQNQQLRVTRRLYLENQDRTVTVTSIYDKILPTADFTVINNNLNTGQFNRNRPNNPVNRSESYSENYVIPNGTQLVAVSETLLSTQTANEGERFRMQITTPTQYAGAIIEGYLSNTQQSAQVADRAQITFNFEKIRLLNGTTHPFSGFIDLVRLPDGNTVRVTSQPVNNANQPRPQTTRSGVGGALGAILGAIVSGGQNAPVETGLANGTGSGTIILRGQNNIDLPSGSEFRIITSVPATPAANN